METVNELSLAEFSEALADRDERLAFVIQTYGAPPLWARTPDFATLVHIILEQQVSLASARAAFDKLRERLGDVTAEGVAGLSDDALRGCYFSRQKAGYVRGLAAAVLGGELDVAGLAALPDHEARAELKKIKGIGDWTADIFLLMALGRPDVMPRGDLALHVAARELYRLPSTPASDEFLAFAERWRPHRATAARILWHFYLSRPKVR